MTGGEHARKATNAALAAMVNVVLIAPLSKSVAPDASRYLAADSVRHPTAAPGPPEE